HFRMVPVPLLHHVGAQRAAPVLTSLSLRAERSNLDSDLKRETGGSGGGEGQMLMLPESDTLKDDLLEDRRISKALHGIKDLNPSQETFGVIICGDALS